MEAPGNKTAISTLNRLIEALVDGEKGYQQAAGEARDTDLKMLFGGICDAAREVCCRTEEGSGATR